MKLKKLPIGVFCINKYNQGIYMKNIFRIKWTIGIVMFLFLTSCQTTYNVDRVKSEDIEQESTIIFVRPSQFHVFGTESLRDYVEVVYESANFNDTGYLEVNVGFRNRGGHRWYNTTGPQYQLMVKTVFYEHDYKSPSNQARVPLYETNWKTINLLRGTTVPYKTMCPNKSAQYYQVVVSELQL